MSSNWFLLTLSCQHTVLVTSDPPIGVKYWKGQVEYSESGYLHYQFIIYTAKKCRTSGVKKIFGKAHIEISRSDAATEYVWKESTRVSGTQWESGSKPIRRNDAKDWEEIWTKAKEGLIEDIDADIRIRCFINLQRIGSNYAQPRPTEKTVYVFCGTTGTGKSRRAWDEATFDAYPKDPNTKFWDGYRGQENVVIDEFRGRIDISHMLRWLDRYPVNVEIKGSTTVLKAKKIWITSNLHPEMWYNDMDIETTQALLRRLQITIFQ